MIIIVICLVAAGNREEHPEEETAPAQTAAVLKPTDPDDEETVIRFAAAGDLNITDKVVASCDPNFDYMPLIADVMPLLAEADLTAMNFEGNIGGEPYGSERSSAPAQILTALAKAGVDILQVANSCCIDNGQMGLESTISTIRAAGMEPLGAYVSEKEFNEQGGYTIWEIKGVRIAVVAFTKGMNNTAMPESFEGYVNLLYTDYSSKYAEVNEEGITSILKKIKKEKPDVTVALLHWGSEYNDTHGKNQEKIRTLMLENGVDAIIGTHPHYVQEIEYSRADGTLVAYSLGDFASDAARMGTEYSIVLNMEITKNNKTGETKITGYSYTPIYIHEEEGSIQILRIDPALKAYDENYLDRVSREVYDAMLNAKQRIEARVKPSK
ncbi:MAG: CapA family protein [Clostridia bacterium]|nr:CapA family protein [Clostridia bacterium]